MNSPTVRQCAVLIGDADTYPGPLTENAPKSILPCGDRSFLAWLLREMERFGVEEVLLLSDPMVDRIRGTLAEIAVTLPRRITITVCEGPARAGTGGALFHARDQLHARFLLLNGDSLFDGGLPSLLADGATDTEHVIGRLALARLDDASRYGAVDLDGDGIVRIGVQTQPGARGIINTGTCLLSRRILDFIGPASSLEGDVLPVLAREGRLRGTVAAGHFLNIELPEDYVRAQRELPHRLRRRALFLDRDGVINVDKGWVGDRAHFEWITGAREAIAAATSAGWHVFIVTNQSGVARGHYTEEDVVALHRWMVDEVRLAGGTVDDIRYCPYHPEATVEAYRRVSDWRKPAPGMILSLIAAWELQPQRCVLVGDQMSDLAAAHAAGIAGHLFPGGDLATFVGGLLRQNEKSVGIA